MVKTFLKVVAVIVGLLLIVVALPVWVALNNTVLALIIIAVGTFLALLGT